MGQPFQSKFTRVGIPNRHGIKVKPTIKQYWQIPQKEECSVCIAFAVGLSPPHTTPQTHTNLFSSQMGFTTGLWRHNAIKPPRQSLLILDPILPSYIPSAPLWTFRQFSVKLMKLCTKGVIKLTAFHAGKCTMIVPQIACYLVNVSQCGVVGCSVVNVSDYQFQDHWFKAQRLVGLTLQSAQTMQREPSLTQKH